MRKFLLFALLMLASVACSDDNDDKMVPGEIVDIDALKVDFENAELNADGILWGKEKAVEGDELDYYGKPIKSNIFNGVLYSSDVASIYSYYSDYGHTSDMWNGFVISNHTDRQTEGYTNDKSVYAESGANGSKNYAVGYYGATGTNGIPTIKFRATVFPRSIAVANSTYTYLYFMNSLTNATKPEFKLVIKGIGKRSENGGWENWEVPVVLNKDANSLKSGWEKIDLSSMGKVNSLEFRIECSDAQAPAYFCIDDLVFTK